MSEVDLKKLEAAHAQLGEAVIDPSRWPSLMEAICEATHTAGAALLRTDVQSLDVPTTPSVAAMFVQYFEQNLHLTDIRAARSLPLLSRGLKVVSDQHLFRSEAEMLRTPVYAHLERNRYRWFSAVPFQSGPAMWVITLQRKTKEGIFDQVEIDALERLCAPLTEVATLSHLVGQQILTGTLHAMQMIEQPAVSLTGTGRIIEANALAESVFDEGFGVRNGKLFVGDQAAAQELHRIIGQRAVLSDLKLHSPSDDGSVIVVRRKKKQPLLIRVLPVHGAARSPFLGARFILVLRDLDAIRRPATAILSRLFSLTPAEARIAELVAHGHSPDDIAKSLDTSRETVRNQIKAVFAKTGTHRQNELAALIFRTRT